MTAPERATLRVLPEQVWRPAEQAHWDRVDALLGGHRERARRGQRHPVEDFLFTYYSLRPARLRRWHPGAGVALTGPSAQQRLTWPLYRRIGAGAGPGQSAARDARRPGPLPVVCVDVGAFVQRRAETVRRVRHLLRSTASRPAQLGCFGLHEWAMVYQLPDSELRHAAWPLRLGPAGTDAVLAAHHPRCTHIDAFRFFTPEALPLNGFRPTRQTQAELEQPGCLHATMDLYKWAYKLLPAVPSELVVDCFELARAARELDMRASPYDLSALGYTPIPIETAAGRAHYVEQQRGFAAGGAVLRGRLLEHCDHLLAQRTGRSTG